MLGLIVLLIVLILAGLALTIWIVWRSASRQAQKERIPKKSSQTKPPQKRLAQRQTLISQDAKVQLTSSINSGLEGSKLTKESYKRIAESLILADVGVELSQNLSTRVKDKTDKNATPEDAVEFLKDELAAIFSGINSLDAVGNPAVWLFVGVNGSGKTTSLAKAAYRQIALGQRVVLAAADTFRAAAIEQLEAWAERTGAGFVKGSKGGDASAVVFDAIEYAKARSYDLVLVDTAGRLHTNRNLMQELEKLKRVAEKASGRVTEILLVIDASTGQNGLRQAEEFLGSVGVTGIVLSKLDGSTKGGIAVAVKDKLGIPIKLVGIGEGPEDLMAFEAKEFVDDLIA